MTPAAFRERCLRRHVQHEHRRRFFDVVQHPASVRQIGFGWATWSHGYTGNVYYTNGQTTIGGNLSAGVKAFYLYAEPNPSACST